MTRLIPFFAISAVVMIASTGVADIADQIAEAARDHAARVEAAKKEYDNNVARSAKIAIAKLESLAKSAVRTGDLASATKAWRQVLSLDSTNAAARDHFKAIGQLDNVLAEIAKASIPVSAVTSTEDVVIDYGSLPINIVELKTGLAYFSDRDYKIVDVPKPMQRLLVTQISLGKQYGKDLTIKVPAGKSIFILCDHRTSQFVEVLKLHQLLASNGFAKVGTIATSDNDLKAFVVLGKKFVKSETLSIPVSPGALIAAESLMDINGKIK